MNFLFAWRYFKAKKSANAINIIAWVSITAIAVGAAALILVLSVFNGFEDFVKGLYSSFYPDVRIGAPAAKTITLTTQQVAQLRRVAGVQALSLVAEEKAMLINGNYQNNIFLRGVDEDYAAVSGVPQHIIKGVFQLGTAESPRLVMGAGVENAVAVQSDRNPEPLAIYTGRKGAVDAQNPLSSVNKSEAYAAGTFVIQQEFDNKYVLTNMEFVRGMLELPPDVYTAAEVKLAPDADVETTVAALKKKLGSSYSVQTRYEQNRSLYNVMKAEKWIIYAILSLILVVAAFNMIGALTMLVLEKRADIAVLIALGATRSRVQKIFLSEGLLLALIGGGAGIMIAFVLCVLQIKYKLIPLQGGSFLIDYFPVKMDPLDFLLVAATIVVIALIAAYLPARRAALQQFGIREE